MRIKRLSGSLAVAVCGLLLASCAPDAPPPSLSSPVHGTSKVGEWFLGSAWEQAFVGPCVSKRTTIEATVDSPSSEVNVEFSRRTSDGSYTFLDQQTLPEGGGTAALEVPAGCYRVAMMSVASYCDATWPPGFPCEVVLPPAYRFTYTVRF